MAEVIEVRFQNATQQQEAWAAAWRLGIWCLDSEERAQLETLREPYVYGMQFALSPGIFAAILCSGVRPTVIYISDQAKQQQSFLFGSQFWSLLELHSIDQAVIEQTRERFVSSMFGPTGSRSICLLRDQRDQSDSEWQKLRRGSAASSLGALLKER